MKKIKKLEPLKPFEAKEIGKLTGGGRCNETRYWDTSDDSQGYCQRDHECPNGNVLFEG